MSFLASTASTVSSSAEMKVLSVPSTVILSSEDKKIIDELIVILQNYPKLPWCPHYVCYGYTSEQYSEIQRCVKITKRIYVLDQMTSLPVLSWITNEPAKKFLKSTPISYEIDIAQSTISLRDYVLDGQMKFYSGWYLVDSQESSFAMKYPSYYLVKRTAILKERAVNHTLRRVATKEFFEYIGKHSAELLQMKLITNEDIDYFQSKYQQLIQISKNPKLN